MLQHYIFRMTLDVFEAQEKSIDEAENEFCENVKKFTSDVCLHNFFMGRLQYLQFSFKCIF